MKFRSIVQAGAAALLAGLAYIPFGPRPAGRNTPPASVRPADIPTNAPASGHVQAAPALTFSPVERRFQSLGTGMGRADRKPSYGERQRVAMYKSRGGGKRRRK